MRRSPFLSIPVGLLLMTGGCMGHGQSSLESEHQPVVSESRYALDLALSGDRLAADEGQRLDGWAHNLRLGYGDRVTVEDPAGDGPGAYREVAQVVGRYGLLLSPASSIARNAVAPATIRVIVIRARAVVPGCPDLRSDTSPDLEGATSSGHGCAVNRNLAAMVANPTDLVHGTDGPATADPAIATRAIDALRAAKPTGNGGTTLRNATAASGGMNGSTSGVTQ